VRFVCNACEKTFESDETDPRCPKCLRRTSVEDAGPLAVDKLEAGLPKPVVVSAADAKRNERALAIVVLPAAVAAFLNGGLFFRAIGVWPALALAAAGGIAWAMIAFRTTPERILATIAATLATSGMVLATTWYLVGRTTGVGVEVGVAFLAGAVPGILAFFALREFFLGGRKRRPPRRRPPAGGVTEDD
jgi:hypothetical protein